MTPSSFSQGYWTVTLTGFVYFAKWNMNSHCVLANMVHWLCTYITTVVNLLNFLKSVQEVPAVVSQGFSSGGMDQGQADGGAWEG